MYIEHLSGAILDPDAKGFAFVEEYPKLDVPSCYVDDAEIGTGTPWAYYFFNMQLAKSVNKVDR